MKLLIGTNNPGKVIEIKEVLVDLPVKILTPKDVGLKGSPEEHGNTYRANALLKAQYFYEASKLPTLADDSGIVVEALEEELGVHTRRWGAGPDANDEVWIAHFLHRMKKEKNKRARFECHLVYIDEKGAMHFFEGRCDGHITETLEADYLPGLPISACFKPDGFDRVFSGLSLEQKNSTSHRGRAAQQFRKHLEESSRSD